MIKIHDLLDRQQCNYKGYVDTLNVQTKDTKQFMISKLYKKVIINHMLNNIGISKETLYDIYYNELDDSYFLTNKEKSIQANEMAALSLRLLIYYYNKFCISSRILHIGKKDIINNIEVKSDLIIQKNGIIYVIKFKLSKPELSYKARNEKNLPENSIELYLMKKLGYKLYPGNKVVSMYFHIKGKNDTGDIYTLFLQGKYNKINDCIKELEQQELITPKKVKSINTKIAKINDILYYDNTLGTNIIKFDSNKVLDEQIQELLNLKLDQYSEKYKSNKCELCSYKNLCNFKSNKQQPLEIICETTNKAPKEMKLTNEQKEVVYNTKEGIYRVNATAGSGKTTVMAIRTCYLIKNGYNPNRILMITFTEKGAAELKEKILYWSNIFNVKIEKSDLKIYTFNSFGGMIINNNYEKLGYSERPQIATNIDIYEIIKVILNNNPQVDWLNYENPLINFPYCKGAFIQLLNIFDKIKCFNYNKDEIYNNLADLDAIKTTEIINFYIQFQQLLKENNLIQYQDQILLPIELFKQDNHLIPYYEHIIVDEYQDTNVSQIQLLKLLVNDWISSLVIVGDVNQSIYSFQNATPRNMLDFNKDFKNVIDKPMMLNFRSTPEICNFANKFISNNSQRLDFNIKTPNLSGTEVNIKKFNSKNEENECIAKFISSYISMGYKPSDICYIARKSKDLIELKEQLEKQAIPNIIDVSELFINNQYVKIVLDLAQYFKNQDYDYYLMQFLTACNKNNEFDKYSSLLPDVLDNYNKLENKDDLKSLKYYEKKKYNIFFGMLHLIENLNETCDLFIQKLKELNYICFEDLIQYMINLALYKDQTCIPKKDIKYNAVTLTTAHSSKGKEWNVVINSINNYSSEPGNNESKEEERRLLFVSFTRAKKELYITYNINLDKVKGKGKYAEFVDEINAAKISSI